MRIALIQPDSPYLTYPLAFPSLGLLYISAYLKMHGHNPFYFDLTGGVSMPNFEADIYAFTCQITQYNEVRSMKERLMKINPNAKFVVGGPFATHSPESFNDFYVIEGEGEKAMLQYVNGVNQTLTNVDPNFFPDWEAIDLKRYGYGLEGKRCINIMTKRGNCPFHCTFCAKQEAGKSPLRFRTVDNVLYEVDYLREKGFEAVAIYDDDVLINKKRDYAIFAGLKERNMPYRCMTRTNLAVKEDLQMLKDTGCAELAIGVESADPHIHEVVCRKGTTVEQDTAFVRTCKEIGLRVKTYLMIGLPGENMESFRNTENWLKVNKPDNFDVSIFTPYPGSHIYSHKEEYDIDWDENELRKIWFSGEAQYGSCAVRTKELSSNGIIRMKKLLEVNRGVGGSTAYWKPI